MPATVSSNGEPQRYWGSVTTANYFNVVRPAFIIGRGFDPDTDDSEGEAPVVVLSYSLWRSRFAGDRTLVGRSIELNGLKVTVVGVTARIFGARSNAISRISGCRFPCWTAWQGSVTMEERLHDRDGQWLAAVGRLRDGASGQAAATEIEAIGAA